MSKFSRLIFAIVISGTGVAGQSASVKVAHLDNSTKFPRQTAPAVNGSLTSVRSSSSQRKGYVGKINPDGSLLFHSVDSDLVIDPSELDAPTRKLLQRSFEKQEIVNVNLLEGRFPEKRIRFGIRADCSEFPLTYDSVKEIARQSNGIEDFVKKLPPQSLQTFTLVYESRAPMKNDVTTMWPRVIRMNKDASLMIAYTCDPEKPSYNKVEIIAYDTATHESKLAASHLSGAPGGNSVLENPNECMSCHSPDRAPFDPRPIWEEYQTWPGVYGSEDDSFTFNEAEKGILAHAQQNPSSSPRVRSLLQRQKEREDFINFKASAQAQNNYCFTSLPWLRTSETEMQNFANEIKVKERNDSTLGWSGNLTQFYPFSELFKTSMFYEARPNLKITEMNARRMADRLVDRLARHPKWPRLKYALYLDALRTGDGDGHTGCELPAEIQNDLRTILPSYTPIQPMRGKGTDPRTRWASSHLIYGIGQGIGLGNMDWHMKFDKEGDPSFHTGAPMGARTRSLSLADMVAGELSRKVQEEYPQFSSSIKHLRTVTERFGERFSCIDDLPGEHVIEEDKLEAMCKTIFKDWQAKKFNESLDRKEAPSNGTANQIQGVDSALARNKQLTEKGKAIVFNNCNTCHSKAIDPSVHSRLNFFESESGLKERALKSPDLIGRMLKRIRDTQAPMPQEGLLSEAEQTALQAYFSSVLLSPY